MVACSSTSHPAPAPFCTEVAGAPDCSDKLEYTCTTDALTNYDYPTGACDPGTPEPDGSTRFCCAGCDDNNTQCHPGPLMGGTILSCRGSSPDPTFYGFCQDQGTSTAGSHDYCCFGAFDTVPANHCVADSADVSCTGAGEVGVACSDGVPPDFAGPFGCSGPTVAAVGSEQFHEYCCAPGAGTCTAGGSLTLPQACSGGAQVHSCTGPERPEQTDPSLACSSYGLVGLAGPDAAEVDYCCIQLSTAATSCKPDPAVFVMFRIQGVRLLVQRHG
jgi:hypothetical protein